MTLNSKDALITKLNSLDLGKAIAEIDDQLDSTFVETSNLFDFICDRYDVIRGAKGTGKSALLLYVFKNKSLFTQLKNVILIKANEHSGDPAFRKAFGALHKNDPLDIYVTAWKIYIINLIYAEIATYISADSDLNKYLKSKDILTKEKSFLNRLIYSVFKAKATMAYNGVEYGLQLGDIEQPKTFIDYNYIFFELQKLLEKEGLKVWVLLDRLDDAFPDWTDVSLLSIKSLFYVYKDLLGLKNVKLKTFVRTDIFDRITQDGFTSLSHINPVTSAPITWDELRIKKFILNRFEKYIDTTNEEVALAKILGKQINPGKRQSNSFKWLLNHLKDGNQIFTPRDVLDYFDKARQHTLTDLESGQNEQLHSEFFTKASLKKAWITVSEGKYQTELCAENPELKKYFEKFSEQKSEYSPESLQLLLGDKYLDICNRLIYVGFLFKYGNGWVVPFLYRPCLNIRQGKA